MSDEKRANQRYLDAEDELGAPEKGDGHMRARLIIVLLVAVGLVATAANWIVRAGQSERERGVISVMDGIGVGEPPRSFQAVLCQATGLACSGRPAYFCVAHDYQQLAASDYQANSALRRCPTVSEVSENSSVLVIVDSATCRQYTLERVTIYHWPRCAQLEGKMISRISPREFQLSDARTKL